MMSQLASGVSGTEPAGATGRGSSVWAEWAGRAVDRDAAAAAAAQEAACRPYMNVTEDASVRAAEGPAGVEGGNGP